MQTGKGQACEEWWMLMSRLCAHFLTTHDRMFDHSHLEATELSQVSISSWGRHKSIQSGSRGMRGLALISEADQEAETPG